MKKIAIFKRSILERTKFKKYRFKEIEQVSIFYDGKESKNHYENIENKKLKKPFIKVFETRKRGDLLSFAQSLGRSNSDIFIKGVIDSILKNDIK